MISGATLKFARKTLRVCMIAKLVSGAKIMIERRCLTGFQSSKAVLALAHDQDIV